jgi:hypothetical protein
VNAVFIVAMLVCMAIGYYLGRICTEDHRETKAYQVAYPVGRHAQAWPLRLRDTAELAALYGKPYPQ